MLISRVVIAAFWLSALLTLFLIFFTDLPFWLGLIPTLVFLVTMVVGTVSISKKFFLPSHTHGSRQLKQVALTFDDGPDQLTAAVADCLSRHQVAGTFFVIGRKVKDHPETLRHIHQQGHVIGNHGYEHRWHFSLQRRKSIADEIRQTSAAIEEVTGKQPRFFRPPFGITNPRVADAVKKTQMIPVAWDVRSFDTVIGVSERLSKRLKRKVKNGSIILLHDSDEGMVGFLDAFIPWLKEQGYEIVSLEKMIDEQAYL